MPHCTTDPSITVTLHRQVLSSPAVESVAALFRAAACGVAMQSVDSDQASQGLGFGAGADIDSGGRSEPRLGYVDKSGCRSPDVGAEAVAYGQAVGELLLLNFVEELLVWAAGPLGVFGVLEACSGSA
jgi:hypothetical protein